MPNNIPAEKYTLSSAEEVLAVSVDADTDTVRKIIKDNVGVAVLNVNSTADELRNTCNSQVSYILPSDQMLADAVTQWKKQHPVSNAQAQARHPDFDKYAASDLNKRFKLAMMEL